MDVMALYSVLRDAWSDDTSASPETWTAARPSVGQGAVTALVVQDFLGGRLMRTRVDRLGSHYWNELPGGAWLDLTADQFDHPVEVTEGPAPRERDYVLSFPETAERYRTLRERCSLILSQREVVV